MGRGVTLRLPHSDNEAWLFSHLREGDQAEFDAAEAAMPDSHTLVREQIRKEICIWVDDELLGIWSSILMQGDGPMSRRRFWAFETTDVATQNWRLFVRLNHAVWQRLWTIEDTWVTRVNTLTLTRYEMAMRWLQKSFNALEVGREDLGGEEHTLFLLSRP